MAQRPTIATGRRKTSSARVFIYPAEAVEEGAESDVPQITVNDRGFLDYFPRKTTQMIIRQPLELTERLSRYRFRVTVVGGGITGQAGAVLLGIARALEKVEPELRPALKKAGFLTRDPRAVERKKPGKRKARRSTQYSKR